MSSDENSGNTNLKSASARAWIATIVVALVVIAVWEFIDYRMRPPPPPNKIVIPVPAPTP